MGIFIPKDEVSVEWLKELRDRVKAELIARAAKKLKRPEAELVVRDILPKTDLGFNSEEWENQTATVEDTWTADWDHELDSEEFIAFYGLGIEDGSENIIGVKFKLGTATTKAIFHLQKGLLGAAEGYVGSGFFDPVFYDGKEHIYVELYGRAIVAQYAGHLIYRGMICTPKGEEIS